MVSIVENAVISSWRLRTSIKSAAMERNEEERSLCDKDNGPRRAHNNNHWRCNGDNKQQLGQHDGATIVHHKHYAVGKDRGIEPQRSAHCPGANVKRRHQI